MTYRNFSPEALNAGRTRRSVPSRQGWNDAPRPDERQRGSAAMEEMTRELEAIAAEIKRLKMGRSEPAYAHASSGQQRPAPAMVAPRMPQQASGIEQMAGMIDMLKADMRAQMRDDLDAQYVRLRSELELLSNAVNGTPMQGEFHHEISSLMNGLDGLAAGNRSIQRSQDDLSGYLKTELSALQRALHGVAKAEGITKLDASLDDRWSALEARWHALEGKLNGVSTDYGPQFRQIHERLAHLQEKAGQGGLEALENRLFMLAKSVDALAQQGAGSGPALSQIDARFDELTRAIAALPASASIAPSHDDAALQQVEQALSVIAGKLETLSRREQAPVSPALEAIERRVIALAEGLSAVSARIDSNPVIERLDRLSDRFAALPAPDISSASLDALTAQVNALSEDIRRGPGTAKDTLSSLGRLDTRLAGIEDRLAGLAHSAANTAPGIDQDVLLETLEARFAELSAQIATQQASIDAAASQPSELDSLERRLIDISNRIAATPASAADPDGLARLESQIADLSDFIASRAAETQSAPFALADLEDGQQRIAIEAARRAADEIAARFSTTHAADPRAGAASDLASDLAELEALTRNSQERQARSFEAIHETLVKLVDRISQLEERPVGRAVEAKPERPVMPTAAQLETPAFEDRAEPVFAEAPSIDPADAEFTAATAAPRDATGARSPVQMARAAAEAAMRDLEGAAPAPAAIAQPAVDEPMEPSTGIPDLNAILKRVRDQKKASQAEAVQAGGKKAYSTAKRAAQAAAAEIVEAAPGAQKTSRLGLASDLYARFRKPILLVAAAAVIAIGGLQLSSALLGGDPVDPDLPLASGADQPAPPADLQLQGTAPAQSALPLETPAALPQLPQASGNVGVAEPVQPLPQAALPAANTSIQAPLPAVEATPRVVTTEQPSASTPVVQGTLPDPASSANTLVAALPQDFGPAPLVVAAKSADARALFEIGRRFAENGADATALGTAFDWFDASAQTGFAPAQYRVGNMLEKGMGTAADPVAAKMWYQMAAEQGNASAMHNLAVLFANGVDGTPDPESAGRWFLEAADLGVADSQYNLGILSAKGEGVPQDLEESYKWFAIVAKSGDKDAAAKRDEVAKALRPEQLESARAKSELWKPKALATAANDITVPDEWRISEATTASVDVKKAVTNVQLILTKLGHDVGPPDGVMGAKTRNAIREFQKAEKLPVTGEIDAALVKALLARNAG